MNLSRPRSIFARIFLTALLPIVLLATLLSAYAINARLDDLQSAYADRGNAKAQQLASLAVVGLFTGDASMLQAACDRLIVSSADIRRVVIHNRDRAVVAESRRHSNETGQSLTLFVAPVIAPVLDIDEHEPLRGEPPLGEVAVYFSSRATAAEERLVRRNALLITLVSVALAVLLTAIAARQIVRPIDRLHDAVGRVQRGDFTARVDELSTGELGELQSGFNAMADQIASSAQTLQQQVDEATASLRTALVELENKNTDLELARRRQGEANRAKSVFLANMSHEIRTPMNGVLGFAGLLQKSELDATQREFLNTIIRSANNLLTIINDILDFSEMESGRLRLEHAAFDLRDAIEDVTGLLTPQAHQKRIELILLIDSDVPERLVGDAARLRQVLTNLIGNAIKFTDRGEVVVHARQRAGGSERFMLEILVSDTGIGIPKEATATLFQPFFQGPVSTRRLYGGTGLGLSISHSLVEAMKGSIEVESRVGDGSLFTVCLPFDIDRDNPQPVARRHGVAPVSAVVVDPHPLAGRALVNLLDRAGYSVRLRNTVPTANEFAVPDLWLLRRPVMTNEADITRTMTAVRRLSHAPVCLLLPSSEPDLKRHVEQFDDCHVQTTPVRSKNLLATLAALTGDCQPGGPAPADTSASSQRWLQGHIALVADDNLINLRLMDTLLRRYGAETLLAHDGEEVLRLVRDHEVDLLLLDIHMPGTDGLEAARQLRGQARYAHIPLIALTADAGSSAEQVDAAGLFDAWLVKPLDEDELRAALDRIVPRAGKSRPAADARCAESAEDAAPPVRDRDRAVAVAGGDAQIAKALFAQLLERLPDDLAHIHARYGDRDWGAMWQAVHRLQGATSVCGVPALHQALQRLGDAVADADSGRIASHLSRLQQEADRLVADTTRPGHQKN